MATSTNKTEIALEQMEKAFYALSSKERVKALRAAARAPMREVQKAARQQLEQTGIRNSALLSRYIGARLLRKNVGFSVAIFGSKKEKIKQKAKSVLQGEEQKLSNFDPWLLLRFHEYGAAARATARGFNRGSLPGRGYMAKAKSAADASKLRETFNNAMNEFIFKTLKKYVK